MSTPQPELSTKLVAVTGHWARNDYTYYHCVFDSGNGTNEVWLPSHDQRVSGSPLNFYLRQLWEWAPKSNTESHVIPASKSLPNNKAEPKTPAMLYEEITSKNASESLRAPPWGPMVLRKREGE